MSREALRKTTTDRLLIALAAFYALLAGAYFYVGSTTSAITWAAIYLAVLLVVGYGLYRTNLAHLRRDAARDLQQHEFDVQMERLAQEADVVAAGGPAADQILARWAAEREERKAREREERQDRIAAYEANQLNA